MVILPWKTPSRDTDSENIYLICARKYCTQNPQGESRSHFHTLGLSKDPFLLGPAVTVEKQTNKPLLYLWFGNTNTAAYHIVDYRHLVEIRKKLKCLTMERK